MNTSISLTRWRDVLNNRSFLESRQGSYTYGSAADYIARCADYLQMTLPQDQEVVPILVSNSPEFVLLILGVMAGGKIPYPLQPNCKPFEYLSKVDGLYIPYVIVEESSLALVKATNSTGLSLGNFAESSGILSSITTIDAIPLSSRLICSTSGTTERPKKVVLELGRMLSNAAAHAKSLSLSKEERILSCLPFYHGFTLLTHIFSTIALEATFVCGIDASPKAVAGMVREFDISYTSFVPALLDTVLRNYDYTLFDHPTLKKISVGSAPVSVKQLSAYREFFRLQALYITYGQTEAGPRITTLAVSDVPPVYWSTVGRAFPRSEIRIENTDENGIGMLQVRAPWQSLGYFGDVAGTNSLWDGGWLNTGDLAQLVGDGFIKLCGRAKDIIISGGVNISPQEVEAVLNALPGIRESMVIGVDDRKRGEVPVALIVAYVPLDAAEIIAAVRVKLIETKIPKRIHFVQNIHRNTVGKPDRKAARAFYMAQAQKLPLERI